MIRTLVVDDSALSRKVVRDALAPAAEIELVDVARDGLDALDRIAAVQPDVITLDLHMPHLDGLGVLRSLAGAKSPRVVVVSTSDEESELGIEALQLGAIEVVAKPGSGPEGMQAFGNRLRAAVRAAAGAQPMVARVPAPLAVAPAERQVEVVAIGTSTGGPPALTRLLGALPADFPVPLIVALHIPAGFTEALAARLDRVCPISVREARDRDELLPGRALIAPGGRQVHVRRRDGRLWVSVGDIPSHTPHRPSVDELLGSLASAAGARGLGVILTGMGDDGLAGARALAAAGGSVLTESAESCVVYGMPRVVEEAGLSAAQAPIDQMAALLVAHL